MDIPQPNMLAMKNMLVRVSCMSRQIAFALCQEGLFIFAKKKKIIYLETEVKNENLLVKATCIL